MNPVTATMLMIGITVILAGVLVVYIRGLEESCGKVERVWREDNDRFVRVGGTTYSSDPVPYITMRDAHDSGDTVCFNVDGTNIVKAWKK